MIQFRDRDCHARTPASETALACLEAGISAALPARVVSETVELDGEALRVQDREYDLDAYDRILVLGGGKAAGGLAAALEDRLGDRIDGGVVVSTDAPDPDPADEHDSDRVTVLAGDHPTPTERNVDATARVLDLADDADAETLVLAVVTGGGSALLCAPATGVSLDDLRRTTDLLLDSGASIDEVNAVRKRCSAVKGGRLARAAAPATVVTLAISDVVGDDPAVIASGPTVPDPTTAEDARAVVERYDLADRLPAAVRDRSEGRGEASSVPGASDDLEESAGSGGSDDPTASTGEDGPAEPLERYHRLATARTAVEAAVDAAVDRGYDAMVLSSRIRGEAREAGTVHAAVAEEIAADGDPVEPPAVVVSGGEVTTTVRGDGVGGPNQELALAAGIEFASEGTDAVLASVDTDGIDGPTDAAGAIVDLETVTDVAAARAALGDNDAGGYLAGRGALLETGYTGTNVNDLRVVVVEGERDA